MRNKVRLYTGSYNYPILTGDGSVYQGNGRGIGLWIFDGESGTLEHIRDFPEVPNASWFTFSSDGSCLYAVNELDDYENTKGGAISAYRVEPDGDLRLLNRLPVMGAAPCHVDVDEAGRHFYTANYNGGSMSSFLLAEDKSLGQPEFLLRREWEGTRQGQNPVRQEKSHVHSSSVHDGYLWITDLGTDEVCGYLPERLGENFAGPALQLTLAAGSGPRSLAFSGNRIYVSCELSGHIAVLERNEGNLILKEMVPGLMKPEGSGEEAQTDLGVENLLGGIVLSPDEKFLYAGNRGADQLTCFRVKEDGGIQAVGQISSGGRIPRGFCLSPDGGWLLAANQNSDNLVVFRVDRQTGLLSRHGEYEAGSVVCVRCMP